MSLTAKILLTTRTAKQSIIHLRLYLSSPLNFYGESKLRGEKAVLAANPDSALSMRVPVLYKYL